MSEAKNNTAGAGIDLRLLFTRTFPIVGITLQDCSVPKKNNTFYIPRTDFPDEIPIFASDKLRPGTIMSGKFREHPELGFNDTVLTAEINS